MRNAGERLPSLARNVSGQILQVFPNTSDDDVCMVTAEPQSWRVCGSRRSHHRGLRHVSSSITLMVFQEAMRLYPPLLLASAPDGRPPRERDEERLHWRPQPQWRRRLAAEPNSAPCGLHIRGKYQNEESNERDSCRQPQGWHEETHSTRQLADASEVHDSPRPGNAARHHSDQIVLHSGEVGAGRNNEHRRQGAARGRGPRPKRVHTQ